MRKIQKIIDELANLNPPQTEFNNKLIKKALQIVAKIVSKFHEDTKNSSLNVLSVNIINTQK